MPDLGFLAESSIDHLRLMLNVGRMGAWELDIATGKAWRNRRHDEIFGYLDGLPEWTYDIFLSHIDPEHRERVDALQQHAIQHGEEWVFECPIQRADGQRRWISAAGAPLKDDSGQVTKLIGHVIDITETKHNEDRLSLLNGELDHRVRNLFAMIKAMITLAARDGGDVASFSESLAGRVAALARAHDLIALDLDEKIAPEDIVRREIDAYPEFRDRIDFDVQSQVQLPASKAQRFAMIVHELMTNAIKYGAFANDTGRVRFSLADGEGGQVVARWTESGGPPCAPEPRQGFGSRLIANALGPDGQVELGFEPEGRVCVIRMNR